MSLALDRPLLHAVDRRAGPAPGRRRRWWPGGRPPPVDAGEAFQHVLVELAGHQAAVGVPLEFPPCRRGWVPARRPACRRRRRGRRRRARAGGWSPTPGRRRGPRRPRGAPARGACRSPRRTGGGRRSMPGASSVPGVGQRARAPPCRAAGRARRRPGSAGPGPRPSPSVCTSPTRLPGMSRAMRRTSDLATNRREGETSCAPIESDESTRKTTSTPLRSTVCSPAPQRGRARASEAPSTARARRGDRQGQPARRVGGEQAVPEAARGPGGVRAQAPAPEPRRRRRRQRGEQGQPEEGGIGEAHGSAVTCRPAAAKGRSSSESPAQASGGKASR